MMAKSTELSLLERARGAVTRGEWQQALDLLTQADAVCPLSGADLAQLADAAYLAGRLDLTLAAWERAHAQSVRGGDGLSAAGAAVRVAMHLLFDTALMAPVRGWLKRAERFLEGHERTGVHAWFALITAYERLLSGDLEAAQRSARQAMELGTKYDPAAAAFARVAEARSLILDGHVSDGVVLLNEAGVAAVSGELDPVLTGAIYCEVVCAFQALAQYDLAEEWTAAMEQWGHSSASGSMHGRCRVHRAEILRLRGACAEAEREVLAACDELRPWLRRELGWPLNELGRIRLRTGDLDGAEQAFRAAHELGWDPQPGLALLALARGDLALAAESVREALEHPLNIPSKEFPPHTDLRRAPLLEVQVEIAVTAGDLEVARSAAAELSRIAAHFESKGLLANAALAEGRVELARGNPGEGKRHFEAAVQLWSEVRAPYETALARKCLAQACRAAGNEERAKLELEAARSALERLAARREPSDRTRQAFVPGTEVSAGNILRREGEFWSMDFEGHMVRLRDATGLHYVARLLANPGHEFHVLDLVAFERGRSVDAALGALEPSLPSASASDSGLLLDAQAKEAYRRRLAEVQDDIENAQASGDLERVAQAELERDFLVRELARAVGLGGRGRRAGSASERARASVTRALRQAIARIQEHHPALGRHLDRAVRTGTYCAYMPDSRVSGVWQTSTAAPK